MSKANHEITSIDKPEVPAGIKLDAQWGPYPEWGTQGGDQDCGELSVWLVGKNDTVQPSERINEVSGVILPLESSTGIKMALISNAYLEEGLRRQGSGSRLYRAFTRLAMEHGVTHLAGFDPRAAAMRARLRVLGGNGVKFYDTDATYMDDVKRVGPEIPVDEGWHRLDAYERYASYGELLLKKYRQDQLDGDINWEPTPEEKVHSRDLYKECRHCLVLFDLRHLDTAAWEPEVIARLERPDEV